MKKMIIIGILLFLALSAGCTYVKPFTDAAGSVKTSIENTNSQAGVCDNEIWRNNPAAICPEKTTQPLVNTTTNQSGK